MKKPKLSLKEKRKIPYPDDSDYPGWLRIEIWERETEIEKLKQIRTYYLDPDGNERKSLPKFNLDKKKGNIL